MHLPTTVRSTLVLWQLSPDGLDTLVEVRAVGLTEDPEDSGGASGLVLEIESHEEGFLAKILTAQGQAAAPDEAIAVICYEQEHVAQFSTYPLDTPRQIVEAASFAWQGFLKAGQDNAPQSCGTK